MRNLKETTMQKIFLHQKLDVIVCLQFLTTVNNNSLIINNSKN